MLASFLRSDLLLHIVQEEIQCQYPLGLIPHFYNDTDAMAERRIRLVSMPSRAYTSFLLRHAYWYGVTYYYVSMPSRAYTSFLHSAGDYQKVADEQSVSMPSRTDISFLREKGVIYEEVL